MTAYAKPKIKASPSPLMRVWRVLRRSRSAVIGLIIILSLVFVALAAPLIATHNPVQQMFGQPGETGRLPSKPPCIPLFGCTEPMHLMGLDLNARDVFSRVVYGTRTSLMVGFFSVSLSLVVGTFIGLIAGYAGGLVDDVLMRLMDVVLAFPSLLLAITIVTILGPGLENALLAIGIVSIPVYTRLTRASVLSLKEMEFVTAARAIGASPARLLFLHIFPNAITPLIVQGTLGVGTAVLEAAALSFWA
jgi:peptide/nickel transport system permease protein